MDFEKVCRLMRKDILTLGRKAGGEGIHYGGSYSLIEILVALYFNVIKLKDSSYFSNEDRIRVVFSKGHGISAYYCLLHQIGIVTDKDFDEFVEYGSKLTCHPVKNESLGIEYSTGSLGQGASIACGTAYALKKKNIDKRVYVILGDGELDEGSNWEAFMFANKYKLDNLTVIIDKNNWQMDGETESIMPHGDLKNKMQSFGFDAFYVDGHNIDEITKALTKNSDRPIAIIANTIKGKGVSFMENVRKYHHSVLSEEIFANAEKELVC